MSTAKKNPKKASKAKTPPTPATTEPPKTPVQRALHALTKLVLMGGDDSYETPERTQRRRTILIEGFLTANRGVEWVTLDELERDIENVLADTMGAHPYNVEETPEREAVRMLASGLVEVVFDLKRQKLKDLAPAAMEEAERTAKERRAEEEAAFRARNKAAEDKRREKAAKAKAPSSRSSSSRSSSSRSSSSSAKGKTKPAPAKPKSPMKARQPAKGRAPAQVPNPPPKAAQLGLDVNPANPRKSKPGSLGVGADSHVLTPGAKPPATKRGGGTGADDEHYGAAVGLVAAKGPMAISELKKALGIGYERAAKMVEAMKATPGHWPEKAERQRPSQPPAKPDTSAGDPIPGGTGFHDPKYKRAAELLRGEWAAMSSGFTANVFKVELRIDKGRATKIAEAMVGLGILADAGSRETPEGHEPAYRLVSIGGRADDDSNLEDLDDAPEDELEDDGRAA